MIQKPSLAVSTEFIYPDSDVDIINALLSDRKRKKKVRHMPTVT